MSKLFPLTFEDLPPKPQKKKPKFVGVELDPTTSVEVKETVFNPNDYKVALWLP